MRIVSLLPSATEIVYALGLGDALVGVTHECDHPPAARQKPTVTSSMLDHSESSSEEIDDAVRRQLGDNLSLYALDHDLLAELRPDLILTQALCEVCAVSFSAVERAVRDVTAQFAGIAPRVLSLEPGSLADILATIRSVGAAANVARRADEVVAGLWARVEQVRQRVAAIATGPRVACLEWIDPPYGPGHWLPELVALAGGTPGLGRAGEDSRRISWGDVIGFAPEVIIAMPCGLDLDRAEDEARRVLPYRTGWTALPAVRGGRAYVVDANAYFSRPGPRIVDSLELLAELIHPEHCAGWGPPDAWRVLQTAAAATPYQGVTPASLS
jgi:iron complex transport system substrate-binding protein